MPRNDPCANNPCQNNGECIVANTGNGHVFYCSCVDGYTGDTCAERNGDYVVTEVWLPMSISCEDARDEDIDTAAGRYIGGPLTDKTHVELILPNLQDQYPENQVMYRFTVCEPDGFNPDRTELEESHMVEGAMQYGKYLIITRRQDVMTDDCHDFAICGLDGNNNPLGTCSDGERDNDAPPSYTCDCIDSYRFNGIDCVVNTDRQENWLGLGNFFRDNVGCHGPVHDEVN